MTRSSPVHAGIIAAGEGSRMARNGGPIKPLVPVNGAPLCHWVARGLAAAGITDLTVLLNTRGRAARASLEQAFPSLALRFIEADTASSWESFRLVARTLAGRAASFLISTVDALIPPEEVRRFAAAMASRRARAGLALVRARADDKPLWADMSAEGRVTALGADARQKRLATAGLYYLAAEVARETPSAASYAALREYLAALVRSQVPVLSLRVARGVDLDRPEDVPAAESLVRSCAW